MQRSQLDGISLFESGEHQSRFFNRDVGSVSGVSLSLGLCLCCEAPLSAVHSGISWILAGFHENSYCANAFSPKGGFQACLAY